MSADEKLFLKERKETLQRSPEVKRDRADKSDPSASGDEAADENEKKALLAVAPAASQCGAQSEKDAGEQSEKDAVSAKGDGEMRTIPVAVDYSLDLAVFKMAKYRGKTMCFRIM